ncbi:uncharacterized protein LOC135384859 [Ornithodoros turicata]|uniref:uncharacterized protein LOC135384859 n=1 Tax=Ornithodoros turicata TaxID=34597 RepID=UPI003139A880
MATDAAGDSTSQGVRATAGYLGHIEPFDPNTPDAWDCYLERMNLYFEANGITEESRRSAFRPATLGDPSTIHFHKRDQREGESITKYMAEIRRLSEFCKFTDLDDMFRDRLVCGIRDQATQKRLFADPRLTLKSALELALAAEAANKNVSEIKESTRDINYTSSHPKTKASKQQKSRLQFPNRTRNICIRCGQCHGGQSCRFNDATCNFCKKKGHLEHVMFQGGCYESFTTRTGASSAGRDA